MSLVTLTATDILEYLLLKEAPSWAANTNFYLSLHTADPGVGGNQTTSEATYGGYDRVAVVRSALGWSVAGNGGSNVAIVTFSACTSGGSTITTVCLGTAASGTGQILLRAGITPLVVSPGGEPPFFAVGMLQFTAV